MHKHQVSNSCAPFAIDSFLCLLFHTQEPSSDVVTSLENLDGVIEDAVAIAVDEFRRDPTRKEFAPGGPVSDII